MLEQLIIIDGTILETHLFKDGTCLQLSSKQTTEPIKDLAYLIKVFCNL